VAEDDVLGDVDDALAGCDAALELLLLPHPATTTAIAVGASAASPVVRMCCTSHQFVRLPPRLPPGAILPALRIDAEIYVRFA
jgi:hypothetical protein